MMATLMMCKRLGRPNSKDSSVSVSYLNASYLKDSCLKDSCLKDSYQIKANPAKTNGQAHCQKGVVLFFALIALVVMSLAAVALIRSVDTNSLIAGNLSFRQATMLAADRGVENAILWVAANPGALNADSAANGYFATSNADARALVDARGIVDTADDGKGNAITYVVQRMCRATGFPPADAEDFCLFGPLTKPVCPSETFDPPLPCTFRPSLIYRVTARVTGPRNTLSYIQTYVY